MIRTLSLAFVLVLAGSSAQSDDDFVSLFNGKDLTGWDGDPALWKVENGLIIGTCTGPESPKHNTFLIWRGDARREGTLKDFELRVKVRVTGDNNSGVQYRSRPLPEAGPWAIAGYQCDIHPAIEHTGMTYEEKGRGIFGLNGQSLVLDPKGERWLVSEHKPVAIKVAEWNEYTVIARGNHLIHLINDQMTSQLTDFDEKGRSLEGLLAFQLHNGNANTVEIKEIRLRVLSDGEVKPFTGTSIPADAKKVERPGTRHPQGLGTPTAPVKTQ